MGKLTSQLTILSSIALGACATTSDLSSCDPNVASFGRTLSGLTSECYEARQDSLADIRAQQDAEREALEGDRRSLLYDADMASLTRSEQVRELAKLGDDIERLRAEIPTQGEVSAERAAEAERLGGELDALKKRVAFLRDRVATADEDIAALKQELAEVLARQDQVRLEIMALTQTTT
jgi:chromosome segregation ATPase